MSKKHDGGPAFPVSTRPEEVDGGYGHQDGPITYQFGGMTLRDYFAAKAMQGFMATGEEGSLHPQTVARAAYAHADAMLAARETATGALHDYQRHSPALK